LALGPDIDFDCVPEARDLIKKYAADRYGDKKVCSVGTWMTYKFRLAIQDVVRAYGGNGQEAKLLTTNLPDSVDDLKDGGFAKCVACKRSHKLIACPKCGSEEVDGVTIAQLLKEHENLQLYNKLYPDVVEMAVRLVGKIKSLGMHAGGLIIADRELFGNIPMALQKGKWTSMWTEGRTPQLSKFGYIKWDVLGLKTLGYIDQCSKLLKKTRNCQFDVLPWQRLDKEANILGRYTEDGVEKTIRMDDEAVFNMLNEFRTETVFQFETDVQRGILGHKARDYYDLQVFNAMGHPGPMDFIGEYAQRRDDHDKNWKKTEHPEVAAMLEETHGIIVYQEQLAALWMKFANFTAPEAEGARKAVAKKWKDKLKPIREQWIIGCGDTFDNYGGAAAMWDIRMEPFGRYAFNKCIIYNSKIVDPTTNESTTIGDLYNVPRQFHLRSYNGLEFFDDEVLDVIDTGMQEVFAVELDNGIVINVTKEHRLLCSDGHYHTIIEIYEGGYDVVQYDDELVKSEST
jgi:DNA polymerase-3 subunit alpha